MRPSKIFKMSIDVVELIKYVTEKQFEFDCNHTGIKITSIILSPKTFSHVVANEQCMCVGIEKAMLGPWKILMDKSLDYDEVELGIG